MNWIFSKTTLLIAVMAVLAYFAPALMLVIVTVVFFAKHTPEHAEESDTVSNGDYSPSEGSGFEYGLHDTSGTNPISAFRS